MNIIHIQKTFSVLIRIYMSWNGSIYIADCSCWPHYGDFNWEADNLWFIFSSKVNFITCWASLKGWILTRAWQIIPLFLPIILFPYALQSYLLDYYAFEYSQIMLNFFVHRHLISYCTEAWQKQKCNLEMIAEHG